MKKASTNSAKSTRKLPPARTPEARERQCESLAFDLAEEQLLNGTASSQVITHFLKLSQERVKLEVLKEQKKLYEAKTEALQSTKRTEELFEEAMKAMRSYRGEEDASDDDEDY